MRAQFLAATLLLACAGCATNPTPVPVKMAPNGDVTKRMDNAAPDTPNNKLPKAGFKDKAVDTDPSSPRTQDRGQKIETPSAPGY